jgi:hypothetical protein
MARNIFDPNGHAVAARDFTFDGRSIKKGDPFNWRKAGKTPDGKPCKLDEHALRGLWLADMIDFADKVDKRGAAVAE